MMKGWQRIPWDGNPALGLEVFRKKFGRGHVSVGIGDFRLISFSFGANSDFSFSSTRRLLSGQVLTEAEAMEKVQRYMERGRMVKWEEAELVMVTHKIDTTKLSNNDTNEWARWGENCNRLGYDNAQIERILEGSGEYATANQECRDAFWDAVHYG